MNKKTPAISQHIVDLFLGGDKTAFSVIYERLKGEIYMFTFKILRSRPDAEDITASVFEKLWLYKPRLDSPAHLKNWLFVTARNRCINALRDSQPTYELTDQMTEAVDPATEVSALEHEQVWTNMIEKLWDAVSKLPPVRRKVVQLRFHENKSVDEIASILGLRPQTVRNHLARGKNQMQELLPFFKKLLIFLVIGVV